jgi:hypothetical protein
LRKLSTITLRGSDATFRLYVFGVELTPTSIDTENTRWRPPNWKWVDVGGFGFESVELGDSDNIGN